MRTSCRIYRQFTSFLSRAFGDESGSVLTISAFVLPVALGFAGLAVDVTSWYVHKRALQSAANAGAVAGALEQFHGSDEAAIAAAVDADTRRNGLRAADGDILTLDLTPSDGRYASFGGAAEVMVQRVAPTFFARFVSDDPVTIAARAVAVAGSGDTCVWVLDTDTRAALKVAGGAQVALDCGVVVNSTDSEALAQSGTGSCITADRIRITGDYTGDCVRPAPATGVAPAVDPLETVMPPSYGACDHRKKVKVNGGTPVTLDPGVYCGAIEVVSDGKLHFNPGLYVLNGAGLKVSAQGTVTGSGVSFLLTENSGTSDAISIQGGATVDLRAAVDGPLPGILFYQDRRATGNISHSLTGGSSMHLEGTLYFAGQDLAFSGGAELDMNSTIVVARTLSFTGHSHVGNLTKETVTANRALVRATLVE